jgi:hypothetical protein
VLLSLSLSLSGIAWFRSMSSDATHAKSAFRVRRVNTSTPRPHLVNPRHHLTTAGGASGRGWREVWQKALHLEEGRGVEGYTEDHHRTVRRRPLTFSSDPPSACAAGRWPPTPTGVCSLVVPSAGCRVGVCAHCDAP